MTGIRVVGAVAFAALVGCSGGGGSSGGTGVGIVQPFTSFSATPNNGSVRLQGEAVTTTFTVDSGGNIVLGPPSAQRASSTVLVTQNGQPIAIVMDENVNNISIDRRSGGSVDVQSDAVAFQSASKNEAVIVVNPNGAGFEYQTYGVWIEGNTGSGSGTLGTGSYGARTAAANVPAAGSTNATYTGTSVGLARLPDGNAYITGSNVSVTTDFSTATLTSTGTVGEDLNSASAVQQVLSDLDFSATGTVTGSGFSAVISGSTSGLSGVTTGQFYGTSAQEVGGTFSASDTNTSYIGSYGAAQ